MAPRRDDRHSGRFARTPVISTAGPVSGPVVAVEHWAHGAAPIIVQGMAGKAAAAVHQYQRVQFPIQGIWVIRVRVVGDLQYGGESAAAWQHRREIQPIGPKGNASQDLRPASSIPDEW